MVCHQVATLRHIRLRAAGGDGRSGGSLKSRRRNTVGTYHFGPAMPRCCYIRNLPR
jgi:hypothetical protein